MQIPEWTKPALWGAAGGMAALAIVAFSAGWVVTSGTADEMAQRQSEKAIISSLTPICVAQYEQDGNKTLLASLADESSWQRGDFVEEHGWATMPGSKTPNTEVADACAQELMKLAKN
jgi:hypothetical protein